MGDLAETHRVLVVDDCTDGALAIAALTRLHGHEARIARDGDEALKVGTMFRPDLVLLDIGLPGQDGYEVARRLRDQEWGAGATLIAMSGLAIDQPQLRAAGFDDNLVKPFDPAALVALIGELAPPTSSRTEE